MQNNQIIDLQEHFERFCKVLHFRGFNSAKVVLTLIRSYLLPNLVKQRDNEPTVI